MSSLETNFGKVLKKERPSSVPLYCPGYPETKFLDNFLSSYEYNLEPNNLQLNGKDYQIIKKIGFDAISIWDFRRGKGGYKIKNNLRVDGWGRIYKKDWYFWDGVFKDYETVENWEHLHLPAKENLDELENVLPILNEELGIILSLPGLFEKTWQSMGFIYFSKCLKEQKFDLIKKVIDFFSTYIFNLISILEKRGAKYFLVADDCGYKNRTFIPNTIWKDLFFEKYKKIVNLIHDRNAYVIIHSDGYVSDLIELFIQIGFDAIQSLEASAGVDIFSLFKEFNSEIAFIGNLDISLLSYGTQKQIKEYTLKLLSKAKNAGSPLAVSPTQQINASVKPENIKTMIETTQKFKF